MLENTIPAMIVAGGRATRLGGIDKLLLPLTNKNVIDVIRERLGQTIGPVALNANGDLTRLNNINLPKFTDRDNDDCGPLAGVLVAMDWAARSGASRVLTLAGDTPFVPHDLVAELSAKEGLVVAASHDEAGRVRRHPLLALWPVALRDQIAAMLAAGDRKMGMALDRFGAKTVIFGEHGGDWHDPFFNINTAHDHGFARARHWHETRCPRNIIGVSGWKNTGKTTLTAKLIAEFTARGLRVGSIKHAHDGFDIDQKGRDSYAHREAGAREVVIASGKRVAAIREIDSVPPLADLVGAMAPCDLVIVEGFKDAPHLKVETHTGGDKPLFAESSLRARSIIAVASDTPIDGGLPRFERDDVKAICDFIMKIFGGRL